MKQRKHIIGKGFVDTLQGVGNYIYQNKDLIAKPLLGAVGNLAALGLTEGGKAVMQKIINKKSKKQEDKIGPKGQDILNDIISGSGIKKF
jgi:hypothetical protein